MSRAREIDELRAWAEWALTDKHEKADGRSVTLARITIAVLDERERDKARIDAALEAVREWHQSEPGSAANGYMMRVVEALTKP